MSNQLSYQSPYPEVNALLNVLLPAVQAILGNRFVGLYLHGSLAYGGFNPETSDIDFLVVKIGDPVLQIRQANVRDGFSLPIAFIGIRAIWPHAQNL